MRALCHLLLLTMLPASLEGTICSGPRNWCEILAPNMVVFIGKETTPAQKPGRSRGITFEIQEQLWGPPAGKVVTLSGDVWLRNPNERRLVVGSKRNQEYLIRPCGSAFNLPLDDPWAQEIRRALAMRAPAKVNVFADSNRYIPIDDARIQLAKGIYGLEGLTRASRGLHFDAVPPGEYEVTATRANFIHSNPGERVSILPGSCTEISIRMESIATVSGQLVDSRAEPVRHVKVHLMGQARVRPHDGFLDVLREFAFRLTAAPVVAPASYHYFDWVETDAHGRFTFKGVYPGWHHLVFERANMPQVIYPGVFDWQQATPFVVSEGQWIRDVVFRLPPLP